MRGAGSLVTITFFVLLFLGKTGLQESQVQREVADAISVTLLIMFERSW